VTIARVSLAAVVLLGLMGVVRADDKKDDAAKADAVDFRKLKELMPAELNGAKRTAVSGEKTKAGELSISHATATYKKGDGNDAEKIEVQIMDYSNGEMAAGLAAAWTTLEIDKETDDGFEKTIKVSGNPGFESWKKGSKRGEVQLLVGKRFIVTVQTTNIPDDQVVKVAEALPLDKLAALK
jgi:hypothetical protein